MTELRVARTNRRGDATRLRMLDAALESLSTGDPDAVSANLIAKQAGATWGAVKYQFGDVDGLWAAVLDHIEERRGALSFPPREGASLVARVGEIVDTLWSGLDMPDARAIDTLRSALPRDRVDLEQRFPRSATALASWSAGWIETCHRAFADLDVPDERIREVAALLPGAIRGLNSEAHLSTYSDVDTGRRTLAGAIATYLAASPGRQS